MISVVIPTYKNKKQLITNLKKNLPFMRDCEIIVVNDNPGDDLITLLKDVPEITLLQNDKNVGFGEAVNRGVHSAANKYVLLLNSDVLLKDRSFYKALREFKSDDSLFAVSFAQTEKDGSVVGKNTLYWKEGLIHHKRVDNNKKGMNAWAEGGACLIDKEKFAFLAGFDSMYAPFYWEDVDLSYRAWKAGFKIIFDPSIVVEHHHESTIGRYFSTSHIQSIAFRNQLVFTWKNITDMSLLKNHIINLPRHIMRDGFFQALLLLPSALIKRFSNSYRKSDKEILQLLHS